MQSKVYLQLKNKTVRDLYWLLFSEPPLSLDYDLSPYSLFPGEILREWQESTVAYFIELDKNSSDLEQFVNRRRNRRLGFYAEALLSYFFQTFNEIELLLQNFQINIHKKTIGEIDFIIEYKGKVIHLECSVKYYMLKNLKDFNVGSSWVGPRLRDNLELKLGKIVKNQIPMGLNIEVQEKINKAIDASHLFIKGVFFAEEAIAPGRINRLVPNLFIRISDLKASNIEAIEKLSRPNWLSALAPIKKMKSPKALKIEDPLKNPILFMFNDQQARFVVPDDWGKNS
ncbi:DUF1853 family protein [Brumimicrobium oceani]|uniref:DUF1853 domain-containing protein n=1 Tax=Brumimicrobium oceani TaxID=2100725 RepID=A0A2U2XEZ4_9FLAO|nr:DUF1853 family protein [Brumimicrobium oceani]PWH86376.1 hypothetical protein DIT68_03805 [Brumimicrobium oceani]